MRHRRFAPLLGFLPAVLLLAISACGGNSTLSVLSPTATRTATATPSTTSTATATPSSTGPATPTATPTASGACAPGTQRELDVTNNSSQPVWVSGGGGALRTICVVSNTQTCLTDNFNSSTGTCMCGTASGSLACPGSSPPSANGKIASARAVPNVAREPGAIPPRAFASIRSPLRPPSAVSRPRTRGIGNCLRREIQPSFAFPRAPSRSMASKYPLRCGGAAELARGLDVTPTEPTA
jgi:hypothetical protein